MTLKWVEITNENKSYLEEALAFYDLSFPLDVREPHDTFLKSLTYSKTNSPNQYHFLVGLENDQVVSFVTAHFLANVNSGFIVYIATNPNVRSKGLGTRTLDKIEAILQNDSASQGYDRLKVVVLESEKEDEVHTASEKEDCEKRNRFFLKNGYALYDDIFYVQPPLHSGAEIIPLNLFIKYRLNLHLPKEEMHEIVHAIYEEKYHKVNGISIDNLEKCKRVMKHI